MPKSHDRMDRISDLIHRHISRLLYKEFKDPRIGMVTVLNVEVSRDLSYAKVYITVFEEHKIEETLKILNQASGFFRSHLAHMRTTPKLHFIYDESVARGSRMNSLLEGIKEIGEKDEP